jgi:DNA repair protein RadA/Sms
MAKAKTVFFCKECGFESAKWLGQCPGCKAWNSFTEEPVVQIKGKSSIGAGTTAKAVPLKTVL